MDKTDLASVQDGLLDFLQHPEDDLVYAEKILDEIQFSEQELPLVNKALDYLKHSPNFSDKEKGVLLTNSWRLLFKQKPPSMEEFLETTEWLGATQESIWPHIKDWLYNFYDPNQPYRNMILTPSIGTGKSYATCLAVFYTIILLYLCRDVRKWMGLSPVTNLAIIFISFTEKKVQEILGEVLQNYLIASPMCHRCKTLEIMDRKIVNNDGLIHWTTAGNTNFMTIDKIHLKVTGSLNRLLGLSPVLISYSELNFAQKFNVKPEEAYQMYMKGRDRINSRFYGHWIGRTILDSSPEDKELPLEKYIWGDASKDPTNYIIKGAQWEFERFKDAYPLYFQDGKSFKCFMGSGSKKAKILEPYDIDKYSPETIIEIPEDLRFQAENNLKEVLKDYAGIPAGSDDRLIGNVEMIERMFVPNLKNNYTYIHAPESLPPEELIWSEIKSDFFIPTNRPNMYQFYRFPNAPRYLSVDLAESHDMATVSMCHLERLKEADPTCNHQIGEKIYVIDFTIAIMATKEKINLEAIKYFIHDLRRYGNINLQAVSFDQYQSSSARQYLKRRNFEVERLSVDLNIDYYMNFVSYMGQNRVKVGKNLVLKNNLKSLIEIKTNSGKLKVDHVKGSWVDLEKTDWMTSLMGYYGKDLSDSVCACIALADLYGKPSMSYIYNKADEEKDCVENTVDAMLKSIMIKKFLVPATS